MNGPPHAPGPIACVVGARPNYMKMAPLVRAFAARAELPRVVLVHTGQHYDVAMNERLFADLELPAPDLNLEVGSGTHAVQTAEVMRRFEPVLDELRAVLRRRRRRRQFDARVQPGRGEEGRSRRPRRGRACAASTAQMPEEINRVLTDQIADLLYTTERAAADNLRARRHSPTRASASSAT